MSAPLRPDGFRGVFRDDAAARAVYSESAGIMRIMPRAVAVPADADDLAALVRWAATARVPLTARGSGSSMANGAIGPGVVVDLRRFDAPPVVHAESRRVRAGAAVVRDRIQAESMKWGLTFPVDPSSGAFATIGGMVATHAAGSRTVRYGALREWVEGVECVFADGTRATVRRGGAMAGVPAIERFVRTVAPRVMAADAATLAHAGVRKEASGYGLAAFVQSGDLLDLIIGSEGTLAFITAVELRLAPYRVATASVLAGFADLESAAATAVRLGGDRVSAVELLDRSFLEIAASTGKDLGLPAGLEAVLLIEAEMMAEVDVRKRAGELRAICEAGGATHIETALSNEDETRLWRLRHAASPILNELAPRLQSMQLVEDGCVPPARFAEYVRGVRQALAEARFQGVIFGHAGDAHAHVNALVDVTEPDWRARCERLVTDVTALVARLGGTISGEHGDGRLRAPLLPQRWSAEALELFAATKAAFDPDGILNPGVKIAAQGADGLGDIKYDPALPPLPAESRAALDLVVRERAWARDRLSLI